MLNHWTLRKKIMGLTLGITLVLGLSASLLVERLIRTAKDSVLETYSTYSGGLQSAIAAQFFERYGDVQTFATNPVLQKGDRTEIQEYLNTYSALYGIYDLIMVVDLQGRLVSVNNKTPAGAPINVSSLYSMNYKNEPWFQAVISGSFTEDKERGFAGTFVEDLHIDPYVTQISSVKKLGNSFSAPIRNREGRVIGVISNRAGSRWIENEFRNLYLSMRKAGIENSELTLLDRKGTVWVDYDPAANGGSTDIVHNFDVVGKVNLVNMGVEVAKFVTEGKSGKTISFHARKKHQQATGYASIQDPKFIPTLGWGVLVRSEADAVFHGILVMERLFFIVFGIMIVAASLASFLFANFLSKRLQTLATRLEGGAGQVQGNSQNLAQASATLSSSATEQAAALQETVASVDEVSSMVTKNAENASRSREASSRGQEASERGKQVVQEMIKSMEDISESNSNIMVQIAEGNQRLSEIVSVIEDIAGKTKVINDIVFQTKLLSFNASVEAARAGEYGKGFAVVAEEVGNLAQMSGTAAKDIAVLLDTSIKKVQDIVATTKSRSESLASTSRQRLEVGSLNARSCGDVLDQIYADVSAANERMTEIAVASKEQAQGVAEINKAMNQLDQVTQQNATASQQCSHSSEELKKQADGLRNIVEDLLRTIQGDRSNFSESPKSALKAMPAQNLVKRAA